MGFRGKTGEVDKEGAEERERTARKAGNKRTEEEKASYMTVCTLLFPVERARDQVCACNFRMELCAFPCHA